MVEYNKEQNLNHIFHALSDQTRRSLLKKIKRKACCVTDLAQGYEMSLNAISKHLKVLERANLIKRKVEGRTHYCESNPVELKKAEKWINTYTAFWSDRLEALEEVVNKKTKEN